MVLAASAAITDSDGRVLLVERGSGEGAGLWSVPGGKVEPGESLEAAAAREVHEETGFVVEVGDELWSVTLPTGDGRTYEIHCFAATVVSGSLQAGDDAADARWVTPEDIGSYPVTENLVGHLHHAGVIATTQ